METFSGINQVPPLFVWMISALEKILWTEVRMVVREVMIRSVAGSMVVHRGWW